MTEDNNLRKLRQDRMEELIKERLLRGWIRFFLKLGVSIIAIIVGFYGVNQREKRRTKQITIDNGQQEDQSNNALEENRKLESDDVSEQS